MKRRDLLKMGLVSGAGATAAVVPALADGGSSSFNGPSPATTPFVDALPVPPITTPVDPFLPDFASYPASRFPDSPGFPSAHCRDVVLDAAGQVRTNVRFFELVEEQASIQFHRDLPTTDNVWHFRDNAPGTPPFSGDVGPTHRVFMNEPQPDPVGGPLIVRMRNRLPPDAVGFGIPLLTAHHHGGHHEARSDGFPDQGQGVAFDPLIEPEPGQVEHASHYDYCFALRDTGFSHDPDGKGDASERPSTLWYHDHKLEFTGANVYHGLKGFFTVFDELDANDETRDGTLRLPSGAFDVPLVLQDRRLDRNAQLVYTPGEFDGVLGDKFLVNSKIQPYFEVQRRKYRFRILDGSNARWYFLFLIDGSGRRQRFTQIAADSSLLSRPLDVDRLVLGTAMRKEVVMDFTPYADGTRLYLANFANQQDGRGPEGDLKKGLNGLDLLSTAQAIRLLEFRIQGEPVDDPSRVPSVLRATDPVPPAELAEAALHRRRFVFERTHGAWAINGRFVDIDRPFATPVANQPELWTLKNDGGGWWHPVHVHLDNMRIQKRNGRTPLPDEQDGVAKRDTVPLGPNDEVEVFLKFRDFPGPFVFHCHNVEHEDMAMMARFDVLPAR